MVQNGMAAGCSAHGLESLGKLTAEQQYEELSRSRRNLEEQLKVRVDTLAYPVGTRQSFSDTTGAALAHAHYRAAFSSYGGVNQAGHTDPYDIRRIAADGSFAQRRSLAARGPGACHEKGRDPVSATHAHGHQRSHPDLQSRALDRAGDRKRAEPDASRPGGDRGR